MTWARTLTIMLAVALAIGLRILLFRTRLGVSMRAVVDNRGLASLAGARSELVSSFSWALGCSLAALAGILLAPDAGMSTSGPLTLLIITAFAAGCGRPPPEPAAHLSRRVDPRAGGAVVAVVPAVRRPLGHGALGDPDRDAVRRAPAAAAGVAAVRAAQRRAAHRTPLDGTRHGARHDRAVRRDGDRRARSCRRRTSTSSRSAMCTALVALSLVPLIGWAGQVSLAPLAFAGHRRGRVRAPRRRRRQRLRSDPRRARRPPGRRAARAARRCACRASTWRLATLAFASLVELVFFIQPFALGTQSRPAGRLQLFGMHFYGTRTFLLLVTAVFGLCGVGMRRAPAQRVRAPPHRAPRQRSRGVDGRREHLETKVAVFMLSAGMAGFAGAFLAQYYQTINQAQFAMLAGLPIVLALVIGGVAHGVGRALRRHVRPRADPHPVEWHLTLFRALEFLAPGPRGARHHPEPVGRGGARSARASRRCSRGARTRGRGRRAQGARSPDPEVGDLGIDRPFTEADVIILDRGLAITNEVPGRRHRPRSTI